MRNLNGLCGYYHHPNVGVNLPWSGYPGLHLNQGEIPKILEHLQNNTDLCSVVRASPPHTCKYPFSFNLGAP